MNRFLVGTVLTALVAVLAISTLAQPPGRPGPRPERDRDHGPPDGPPPPPDRLLRALDTDHDGEISAEEIAKATESLKKLDDNSDGRLSRDELQPPRPRGPEGRGPDFRGPGERGPRRPDGPPPGDERRGRRDRPRPPRDDDRPPRDDGPRRPPGPPGPPHDDGPQAGGPPLLPPFARDELKLSDDQQKQLDALRAEVHEKLEKILTPEQRDRLAELQRRGPGGPPDGPPPPGRPPRRGGPPGDRDDDDDDGPGDRPE